MSKKPLTSDKKEECLRLKAIFNARKSDLGLTQERLAHALDINQSSVSHYLNGVNPLNAPVAASFAQILGVNVSEFSERLAGEIARLTKSTSPESPGAGKQPHQADKGHAEIVSNARRLAMDASPRSRSALEKIAGAAESGLLSEEDMLLLEVIADRLSSRKADQSESPHQRLRKKLTKNDPFPQ